jgi:hypothetical protein
LLTATTSFLKPDNVFYADSVVWPTVSPWCVEVKSWFPESLRTLTAQGEQLLRGQVRPPAADTRQGAPAANPRLQGGLNSVPQDYAGLIALVRANPQLISQAWREKVESASPEQVDAEFLRRFISENRALFSGTAPAAPNQAAPGQAATGQASPGQAAAGAAAAAAAGGQAAQPGPSTWPTPANE